MIYIYGSYSQPPANTIIYLTPPTPLEFFFDPCIHVHEYYNIVHVTLIQISKWKPTSHIACYNKVSNQTKYKT